MSLFRTSPRKGYGFIYILSNPSMQNNIYKIGFTRNNIDQRTRELNTTSIPVPFEVERLYEVKLSFLRQVESKVHSTLRRQNCHFGKEFFSEDINTLCSAIEDVINEITNENPSELVETANELAKMERNKRIEEKEKKQREDELLKLKKDLVRKINLQIDNQRQAYISNEIGNFMLEDLKKHSNAPFIYKCICMLGSLVILLIPMVLAMASIMFLGGWGFIVSGIAYICLHITTNNKEKKSNADIRKRFTDEAYAKFPYCTIENVDKHMK